MKQESFSDMEYGCRRRKTKREEFLGIMDEIIPWEEWVGILRPYYPSGKRYYPSGKRGRPPMEIELMLRMYLLQCWFNLSDEGVEDAIYDSYAMRKFMGINFFEQDVPDATTLLHFRHLLEEHGIGKLFFDAISRCLEQAGRRSDDAGRQHCRRHTDQRAQLHQKQAKEAGSRNAPDQKGQSMAFRHEVPHRRGRGQRLCPYGGSHTSQCP